MNISLKSRIYWSFTLLVFLFVLNGIITLLTLHSNKKLAIEVFKVLTPTIQSLDDFKKIMLESKMYTTNWVFQESDQEDKLLSKKLHDSDYAALKSRINVYSSKWTDKNWIDSLNRVFAGFEKLLAIEQTIMNSLKESKDYHNPVTKHDAERKVKEEVFLRTATLLNSLNTIQTYNISRRVKVGTKLEKTATKLRILIIVLTITIILIGFFLSLYMTKIIIRPVNRIREIINNLGKGIIQNINRTHSNDEIGKMIDSVNNLSEKLQATATFAYEIGRRHFDMPFNPISDEDSLGKALIAMRDNIKLSDEKLNDAQHIAHIGSWERDIKTDKLILSDEMFNIFDLDPVSFDFQFQSIMKFIHPDDIKYALSISRKNLYRVPEPYECRIVTSKGAIKNISVETKIVLGKYGEVEKTFGIVQDITERKKVEEQIKLSNERYELVIKTTNDMIWDWNLVDNTIFRNQNYVKLFGADEGGRNEMGKWIEHVHPEDNERVSKYIQEKIDDPNAESWELEFRYFRHNGEMAFLFDRGYIIRDENKKATRMVGATSDITERKIAEEALSNNELRFRTLTHSAPVGIFQTDIKGKTIYVNETLLEYTGMSVDEITGYGWVAAVHPEDREIMVKRWNESAEKGLESITEYRLMDKKGNIRWVTGKAVPIFTKEGNIFGHIGTVSDITERKLAIESLQQSEIKYRQIVETAQEGIWVIDENNYTVFVNKKMCEMLGYSEDEIIGKQNYFFKDDKEKKRAAEQIERRKNGIIESHDSSYITKKGDLVWGHVSSNPIYNEDGTYKGALAMITDITQRKFNEELLQQSKISLAVKNKELEGKNKELEQFAYVASHDLQEPLRTTTSFVELLQQQYQGQLDEQADKYLSYILQSSDRMKVLINDLLDYSRIGNKRKLQSVDANILLQEVLADIDVAIKETKAEIVIEPLPVINGYPSEIKLLFQNLIVNAIKFSKKDSTPKINISSKKTEGNWEFAFKDNGIGIEKKYNERIFIIFQRLHLRTEYKGSGIGLSHCKKIVELHNGKIWVDSTLGQGSTFHFNIPEIGN